MTVTKVVLDILTYVRVQDAQIKNTVKTSQQFYY